MKVVVNIYFTPNPVDDKEKLQITIGCEENEYNLDIYTRVDENLDEVINEENIRRGVNDFNTYSILDTKVEKDLKKYLSNHDVLRDYMSVDSVEIIGEFAEIATYLKNNPNLESKKIIIGNVLDLDIDQLNELKRSIDSKKYNILVKIQGNSRPITLDEYEKTINIVNEMVNKIKGYNYSPLETLIYVYDLVRDRVYVKEDDEDKYYESRDLTSVLLGDKIVCLGYVRLFNIILEKLGFKCFDFILDVKDSSESHARSLVYLNDDKYAIKGLYFFDPTFDSKKSEGNISFLNRYLYFAKTYNQLAAQEKDNFVYSTYKYFDNDKVIELEEKLIKGNIPLYKIATKVVNEHINWMLRFVGKDFMAFSTTDFEINELLESMYEVVDLANRPIDVQAFLKALYAVRKNEYYEQPTRYAFDMDSITNILINSKLLDTQNELSQLYSAIFGVCITIDEGKAQKLVSDFFKANNLDIDMGRVKLVRVLKTVHEKKALEDKK